jgi:hypothetical protein
MYFLSRISVLIMKSCLLVPVKLMSETHRLFRPDRYYEKEPSAQAFQFIRP